MQAGLMAVRPILMLGAMAVVSGCSLSHEKGSTDDERDSGRATDGAAEGGADSSPESDGGGDAGGTCGPGGNGGSGGSGGDAGHGGGGESGEEVFRPAPSRDCVVAERLDECCENRHVISRAEFESSPCWIPIYAYRLYAPARKLTECEPEEDCSSVDCVRPQIAERRTAGFDQEGKCVPADECETDEDCVFTQNWRSYTCCLNDDIFPKFIVDNDPCVGDDLESIFEDIGCLDFPDPDPCTTEDWLCAFGSPRCVENDSGVRICRGGPKSMTLKEGFERSFYSPDKCDDLTVYTVNVSNTVALVFDTGGDEVCSEVRKTNHSVFRRYDLSTDSASVKVVLGALVHQAYCYESPYQRDPVIMKTYHAICGTVDLEVYPRVPVDDEHWAVKITLRLTDVTFASDEAQDTVTLDHYLMDTGHGGRL
jgi:hypothetical protein